ncbi:hypothetical protein [Cohnella soli]|uniref:Uncharacterized protein n=1 Tax=Cohnella soli TaxID=425005 RepID=A0ABW0HMM1_9BACL
MMLSEDIKIKLSASYETSPRPISLTFQTEHGAISKELSIDEALRLYSGLKRVIQATAQVNGKFVDL